MNLHYFLVVIYVYIRSIESLERKQPTILIAILARNKAHTLPYFLTCLERLNYPKNRISLWIRSDHNVDNTIEILKTWLTHIQNQYHAVRSSFQTNSTSYAGELGPGHWTADRYQSLIGAKQASLQFARTIWADYYLQIDCDAFLVNEEALNLLIATQLPIVAPMLHSLGLYSNFWAGITDDYYYKRTDRYETILERKEIGCFVVPMVHSCVLVDLRFTSSDLLTYSLPLSSSYNGPIDDIIMFAIGAQLHRIPLNVCNDKKAFGYILMPLEQNDPYEVDLEQLTDLKLHLHIEDTPLLVSNALQRYIVPKEKTMWEFERVFMINLERRPHRRRRMMSAFDELGLDVELFNAIDGKQLNESILETISFLPEYQDPYHKRPMKMGEIGCFLSHYSLWQTTVNRDYNRVLILEDDVRFEPFFHTKIRTLLKELDQIENWDLVYLGRKKLEADSEESWLTNSTMLVYAGYSYWTLGYVLSKSGAEKLINSNPLSKLLPVDEYLPIMFDKHPDPVWKSYFPQRDVIAFSVAPLLLYPTHYTNEKGYISDTEQSSLVVVTSNLPRDDL